jgi:WD40 repeat protein
VGVRVLKGHTGRVHHLAYAPDGRTLASSAGRSLLVRLWDLGSADPPRCLRGPANRVRALAFAPDARLLAATDLNGRGFIWEPASGRLERRFGGEHAVGYSGLAFVPGRSALLTATRDLYWWDIASPPGEARTIAVGQSVLSLGVTPDGRTAALGRYFEPAVTIWDLTEFRHARALPQRATPVAVAFAPDGRYLAVIAGWRVVVWDWADGREVSQLRGHAGPIAGMAFTPDARTIATAGIDQTVRFWDAASGRERQSFVWSVGKVTSVAFAPDGLTVAVGGENGAIVIWDCDAG